MLSPGATLSLGVMFSLGALREIGEIFWAAGP